MPAERVESVFCEALTRRSAEERAAFLRDACRGDRELLARVEALLAAHDGAGSYLDLPTENGNTVAWQAPLETVGTEIGPYKLLEQIGEGGFGVVYLAEQKQPLRRRVALKILKPGMDSRQIVARFEAERQALALMDHPNIAKVLDAGVTPAGRPFFVMELVKGIAITDYCNQCSLTTTQRLQLFISVCHAVQHAHQKGVIHRDIKPSNVLVAIQDGNPIPKVIDFGVAKAINQRLTEDSLHTGFAQLIGTPLYMSPEQAEMSPLEIDTRGDIYSLGVLLYELLTGTTPFERDRFRQATFDEMRRIIRTEEPPLPSARLSTLLADASSTVASQRRTEPRRLIQTIRGDLDWIAMKCLEKDRTRRYETANALAQDVVRYMTNEPVSACPPSASYRIGKLIRRNRLAFASSVALAAMLITAATVCAAMYFNERAAREQAVAAENRANQTINLFVEIIAGSGTSLREVDPALLQTLLDQADSTTEAARALNNLGLELHDRYRYAEAESFERQALKLLNRRIPGDHPEKAIALNNLGLSQADQGKFVQANQSYQEGIDMGRRIFKEEPWHLAKLLSNHGTSLRLEGRYGDAKQVLQEAFDIRVGSLGDRHPDTADSAFRLAELARDQGDLEAARGHLESALRIWNENPSTPIASILGTTLELAGVHLASGDLDVAEKLAKQTLSVAEMQHPNAFETAYTRNLLGGVYLRLERKDDAYRFLRSGYEGMVPYLPAAPVAQQRYYREALQRLIEYSRAVKDEAELEHWEAALREMDQAFAARRTAANASSTSH